MLRIWGWADFGRRFRMPSSVKSQGRRLIASFLIAMLNTLLSWGAVDIWNGMAPAGLMRATMYSCELRWAAFCTNGQFKFGLNQLMTSPFWIRGCSVFTYRVSFLTGAPLKVSDYIVNPIKKVLSVRIYLPADTFLGDHLKKTPWSMYHVCRKFT